MWTHFLAVCMSFHNPVPHSFPLLGLAYIPFHASMVRCASQAEQLIRARLAATPDEPRLWCALGDLNLDDDAYRKAWDCSVRC